MGPPDTKESLFRLQTLPCLGVGRGQAVCYRKGAGLAGGRTSNLPWPPQDTLYFATMTARRGCRACREDSVREDLWDEGQKTCALVLCSEPGLPAWQRAERGRGCL